LRVHGDKELAVTITWPDNLRELSTDEQKQLAFEMGFLSLSRRKAVEQLLHKEHQIRKLKQQLAVLSHNASRVEPCLAPAPRSKFLCERETGHSGDHEAGSGRMEVGWPR
jgi:hypothetical protein